MEKRAVKFLLTAASVVITVLLLKIILPCLLPFILAFLAAWLLDPVVRGLARRFHMSRGFASALCILLMLAAFMGLFSFVFSKLLYEAIVFIKNLPVLLADIPDILARLESSIMNVIQRSSPDVRDYCLAAIDGIITKAQELPGELSSKALTLISDIAANAPGTLLACGTFLIGTFFISSGFPDILAFLRRQVPARLQATAAGLKRDVLLSVGKWLKAQLTLMSVTFIELTVAFAFLKVQYAAIIAAITAFIDALPVFGTGVVLLPWAAVRLIAGDVKLALGLLATYLVVIVVRNFLEPKVLGNQFGIHPVAALLAMYSGFRLAGVVGMVLFPPALMVLKMMNDKGYVRLWKKRDADT